MSLYDLKKQVHSLSIVSNMCFGMTETPEVLQNFATKTLDDVLKLSKDAGIVSTKHFLGHYVPVWGPVVWSDKDQGAKTVCDNNMFLVYREDTNQYVLAIAGTNINSLYGWFVEDFQTAEMVEWNSISTSAPATSGKIAVGTHKGFDALLNKMVDGDKGTIIEFLTKEMKTAKKGAGLSVGGHSLGGTLTPVMATYLMDTKDTWDPDGNIANINAYPTAGATPGNGTFAKYVEGKFTGANDYFGAYNPIDVVPHGWQADMLKEVPGLYASHGIPKPGLVVLATDAALAMTFDHDYTQITTFHKLELVKFIEPPTKIVDAAMNKIPKEVKELFSALNLNLENHIKFFIELGIQHVTAYSDWMLGIEGFFLELYHPYMTSHKPSTEENTANAIGSSLASLGTKYKTAEAAQ